MASPRHGGPAVSARCDDRSILSRLCWADNRKSLWSNITMRIVRCSLIQATNAAPPDSSLEATKKDMLDKHVAYIEKAPHDGAQIVCLQEIFYGPYFCAEQTTKWYDFTERIP